LCRDEILCREFGRTDPFSIGRVWVLKLHISSSRIDAGRCVSGDANPCDRHTAILRLRKRHASLARFSAVLPFC
jgi:hypothetical protein